MNSEKVQVNSQTQSMRQMHHYRDLFQAMFKIPDKEVQKRIINAINGSVVKTEPEFCVGCNKILKPILVDVSTQTRDSDHVIEPPTTGYRRRKRKKCLPQVMKKSQHHISTLAHKVNRSSLKRKIVEDAPKDSPAHKTRRSSLESVSALLNSVGEIESDTSLINDFLTLNTVTVDEVKIQMLKEWNTSESRINGFLPIHDAIMDKDLNKLKRQIFVWKAKQVPLGELLTVDGDDPLQLSLKHESNFKVIQILLESGIDLDTLDGCSNNLIHLFVMNSNSLNTHCLHLLLENINLNCLLQLNDEGYTPLHIAVRNNLHIACEMLLKFLDNKLALSNEKEGPTITDSVKVFKEFYYKKSIALLESDNNWLSNEKAEFKKEIVNATCMKRGCTPLFYALENESYPIIYLLLSHLADPNVRNHSGQTAKFFFSEYGNNTKIEKLLTKIESILQKHKKWKK